MSFIYENFIDPILENVRQYTPVFAGIKAGDRVLDVCSGTGAQVIEYGKRDIIATGIDADINMINTALRKKTKQSSSITSFYLADGANLPFSDNCFDYVSISFGIHDKGSGIRSKIVSEMKRVVKKDGALILIDYQVPLPKNIWAIFTRTIEFIAGGSHYQNFKDYMNNGGLDTILKNHHLVKKRVDYLKNGLVIIIKAKTIN